MGKVLTEGMGKVLDIYTNLIIICVCITLLIAGILFWPTLYRYDKIGNAIPIRINRITGYTEYFADGKWNPEARQGKTTIQTLPEFEQVNVTGKASLEYGTFSGDIYNGSEWTITELVFRVVAKEKDDSIRWDRKFSESMTIEPLSTCSFSLSVLGNEDVPTFDWYVEEALGYEGKQ